MEFDAETIDLIHKTALFNELNRDQLELILPLMEEATIVEGATIIHEGEREDDIYIVKEGEVEVYKEDKHTGEKYRLSVLGPGAFFGEMSIFDSALRSASVRALRMTKIVFFSSKKLASLSRDQLDYSKIALNIAKHISERLKNTNEVAVKSLKEELRTTKAHDQMGQFFIYVVVLLTLYFYLFKLLTEIHTTANHIKIFSTLLTALVGFCMIKLVKMSGLPLQFYGVKLKAWKESLVEGFLFTLPMLLFLTLFKWFLIHNVESFSKVSLFYQAPKASFFSFFSPKPDYFFLLATIYLFLVPVQEFITRGCVQSSLQYFFRGPRKAISANLITNLLFGIFHGHQTFTFAIAAFILGMFWGWLYARHQNLISPIVSHIMVGGWAFMVLDFGKILIY